MTRFFDRVSRGEFSLNRTEAFSDAVFAIIVTLFVLELKAALARVRIHAAFMVYALTPLFSITPCNGCAAPASATHTNAKPRR